MISSHTWGLLFSHGDVKPCVACSASYITAEPNMASAIHVPLAWNSVWRRRKAAEVANNRYLISDAAIKEWPFVVGAENKNKDAIIHKRYKPCKQQYSVVRSANTHGSECHFTPGGIGIHISEAGTLWWRELFWALGGGGTFGRASFSKLKSQARAITSGRETTHVTGKWGKINQCLD